MSVPRVSQPLVRAPAPQRAGFMVLAAILSALRAGSARTRVQAAG